jgi:O6-methylguanine-DNA--protein-cysteine methyltransferase
MGIKFSAHSVVRTLIKVYQCSIIKQTTRRNTWDLFIPKFHHDVRATGTLTGYRLHISTKISMYIL